MIPELATYDWMQAFGPHGAAQEEGSALKGDEAEPKGLAATARAVFCEEDPSSGEAGETKVVGFTRGEVVLLVGLLCHWGASGGIAVFYLRDGRWGAVEAWRYVGDEATDWGDTSGGKAVAASTLTALIGACLSDDQIRAMGLDHGRVSQLEEQAAALPKFQPAPMPEPEKPRQIDPSEVRRGGEPREIDPEEVRGGGYVPVEPDDLALAEELVRETLALVHFSDGPGGTEAHTDEAEIRVARMIRAAFDVRSASRVDPDKIEVNLDVALSIQPMVKDWATAIETCLDYGVPGSRVVRALCHVLDQMEEVAS